MPSAQGGRGPDENRHDQTGQDLDALAGLLRDLATDMPPRHPQQLKDHLITELRRAEPSRPRRRGGWHLTSPHGRLRHPTRLIVGAGAAVASLAGAAIAISITSQQGLPPATPAAIRLLAKAADAAAHQPTPHVQDGQYMFAETREVSLPVPLQREPLRQLRLRLEKLRPQKFTSQIWMPVGDVCRMALSGPSRPRAR